MQVECLKLLFNEMIALRREFSGTPEVIHFKQPIFHIMPILVRHAVSGIANFNSEDLLFETPAALAMLIDIFSERGFYATVDVTRIGVPLRIDLQTGEIYSQVRCTAWKRWRARPKNCISACSRIW